MERLPNVIRTLWRALATAVLLAGCAQLAPAPQDLQAKRFAVPPDKAVIYVVRDRAVLSDRGAPIWLGNFIRITTYPGTYFRWEVTPGVHRITGDGADFGTIALEAAPGRIYFVEQQLSERHDVSYFYVVDEQHGRAVVGRAALLAGW